MKQSLSIIVIYCAVFGLWLLMSFHNAKAAETQAKIAEVVKPLCVNKPGIVCPKPLPDPSKPGASLMDLYLQTPEGQCRYNGGSWVDLNISQNDFGRGWTSNGYPEIKLGWFGVRGCISGPLRKISNQQ